MSIRAHIVDYINLPGLVSADLKDILVLIGGAAVVVEALDNPRASLRWRGWRQERDDLLRLARGLIDYTVEDLQSLHRRQSGEWLTERTASVSQLKLYRELAAWWPLFSPPDDYVEEASYLLQILQETVTPRPRTVLELGSGGGSNAFHLKKQFTMTLVDIAPDMLAVSQAINPECEHLIGDMRSVRLGRQFDAVFIHDAIVYMTTEDDLRLALETAYVHCRPGGMALLVPDYVRETFEPTTKHGGRDGAGRALRYLEWQFDPDVSDNTYNAHWAFLLREGDSVHVEHDAHQFGLFLRSAWLQLLHGLGFEASSITDPYNRDVFVAVKPESRLGASTHDRRFFSSACRGPGPAKGSPKSGAKTHLSNSPAPSGTRPTIVKI